MKGLWSVYTAPIASGLVEPALCVIWLVLIFLLASWIANLAARCQSWESAVERISSGLFILLGWYIVHSVDLWLHAEGVGLPFGYLITEPVFECARVISNIAVIRGTAEMVLHDLQVRSDRWHISLLRVSDGLELVLLVLGSYFIGLYIALAFVWVFVADATSIEDIARRRNEFETSFAAFQFISMFFLVGCCARSAYTRLRYDRHVPTQAWLIFGLTLALFTRSFSELIIIAGRNGNSGPLLSQTALAREVTFGLFSVFFAILVWWFAQKVAHSDMAPSGTEPEKAGTRRWILDYLNSETQQSRVSAPAFSTVTQAYRSYLHGNDDSDAKLSYMDDLETRFAANVH